MRLAAAAILAVLALAAPAAAEEEELITLAPVADLFAMGFEEAAVGSVPTGWQIETAKKPAADWKVAEDRRAARGSRVLRAESTAPAQVLNLCWFPAALFLDGEVSAQFRLDGGKSARAAGIVWRVKDPKNYYAAVYDAAANVCRIEDVRDGKPKILATAPIPPLGAGWHAMRATLVEDKFEVFLDGVSVVSAKDERLAAAGGIGLLTLGDTRASFDDYRIA